MDVKKEKQPRTHEETARVGTPGPMIKEHSQQQADKYEVLLKVVKSARVTQAVADVPEDGPQSENADEKGSGELQESPPEVQEGRGHMLARSNAIDPAVQQWDAEAQGPEHDGAYLEQETCLR